MERNAFEKPVLQTLAKILGVELATIDADAQFADLGMDSLLGLRFSRRLSEAIGREIDPEWLYDHSTSAALSAFLATHFGHEG